MKYNVIIYLIVFSFCFNNIVAQDYDYEAKFDGKTVGYSILENNPYVAPNLVFDIEAGYISDGTGGGGINVGLAASYLLPKLGEVNLFFARKLGFLGEVSTYKTTSINDDPSIIPFTRFGAGITVDVLRLVVGKPKKLILDAESAGFRRSINYYTKQEHLVSHRLGVDVGYIKVLNTIDNSSAGLEGLISSAGDTIIPIDGVSFAEDKVHFRTNADVLCFGLTYETSHYLQYETSEFSDVQYNEKKWSIFVHALFAPSINVSSIVFNQDKSITGTSFVASQGTYPIVHNGEYGMKKRPWGFRIGCDVHLSNFVKDLVGYKVKAEAGFLPGVLGDEGAGLVAKQELKRLYISLNLALTLGLKVPKYPSDHKLK